MVAGNPQVFKRFLDEPGDVVLYCPVFKGALDTQFAVDLLGQTDVNLPDFRPRLLVHS